MWADTQTFSVLVPFFGVIWSSFPVEMWDGAFISEGVFIRINTEMH